MIWMALLDVFLAHVLLSAPGLDRPVANAYVPCATPVICDCPADSPCKKGCSKGDCCCKDTKTDAAVTQAACTGGVCTTAPAYAVVPPPMPASPMGVMPEPRLYQVELKIGKWHGPRVTLPVGQVAPPLMISNKPGSMECYLVHVTDSSDGLVKVFVQATMTTEGCGGYPCVKTYQGKKKVQLDTASNVLLAGEDAEPLSAEVLVQAFDPNSWGAYPMPPSAYCPCPVAAVCPAPVMPTSSPAGPPMPAPQAPMVSLPPVQAVPVTEARVCLPEPLPLPMPAPAQAPTQVIERCVAVKVESCAYVELVHCCDKSALKVTSESDGCVKSVRMTIDKGDCGALTVAAGKKYVHVHGKKWKASADRVEISPDGCVKLMGNVKLISDKVGVCTSVKAESLCVRVKAGKLEKVCGH